MGEDEPIVKKPIHRVAKGSRREKQCADELIKWGYTTWKTVRHRFLNIDLFGLFDVVGLAPEGDHLLFIQVKSNHVDKNTRERIRALKMPKGCIKEICVYKDRCGHTREVVE